MKMELSEDLFVLIIFQVAILMQSGKLMFNGISSVGSCINGKESLSGTNLSCSSYLQGENEEV